MATALLPHALTGRRLFTADVLANFRDFAADAADEAHLSIDLPSHGGAAPTPDSRCKND